MDEAIWFITIQISVYSKEIDGKFDPEGHSLYSEFPDFPNIQKDKNLSNMLEMILKSVAPGRKEYKIGSG